MRRQRLLTQGLEGRWWDENWPQVRLWPDRHAQGPNRGHDLRVRSGGEGLGAQIGKALNFKPKETAER